MHRAFILALFSLVAALELCLTVTTLRFVFWPETVHQRLPMDSQLVVTEALGELVKGDQVLAVDGVPVDSRAATHRAVVRRPIGEPVRLRVLRDRTEREVLLPSRSYRRELDTRTRVYSIAQNILMPWCCVLLAAFVTLKRPRDPMAWLVAMILLGQAQFNSFLFQVDAWPAPLSFAMRLLNGGLPLLAAPAWLLFGYDFPDRRRRPLLGFLRWPGVALTGFLGIREGIGGALRVEIPLAAAAWDSALAFGIPTRAVTPMILATIALGFANLVHRLASEQDADSRRRLRLLVWGIALGRGPVFLMEATNQFGFTFNDWPLPLTLAAFLLMTLVPLTFAYVLIVERAMDVGVVVRQGVQYAFARRGIDVLRTLALALPLLLIERRVAALATGLSAFLLVRTIAERLRVWIDRRFFRDAVRSEQLLAGLGTELRGLNSLQAIADVATSRVREALHIERAEWLPEPRPGDTSIPLTQGFGALSLGPKRSEEPYSQADLRLLESVAHQTSLAMENARLAATVAEEVAHRERMRRELEIARDVQARLLPKADPQIAGFDVAGLCRPAQSIGGDSYDYLPCADGRWVVAIADVAGKGVPAALLMSNLQAALRGLVLAGHDRIEIVMGRLNQLVFDSTPANRFITFFALAIAPDEDSLTYSSAGHNPAALLRAGAADVEWLRTKGVALGLRRNSAFVSAEQPFTSGDLIVLYTDGVTEAVNPQGEEFGEQRLASALLRLRQSSAAALRDALIQEVDLFVAGAPQHDDITIAVLRRL
ncbi:MAG: SpoIIE family protein phosphatase [Bryobacterales bacterium]|nr:SpoIIE family protein phosphatase [Bryobacterales bacterium]